MGELFDEALEASDGKQALDLMKDNIPDLIVSDFNMPNMNAIELVQEMRKDKKFDDVFVIIVSSRVADDEHKTLQALGVKNFVQKPVASTDVKKNIKAFFASSMEKITKTYFDQSSTNEIIFSLMQDVFARLNLKELNQEINLLTIISNLDEALKEKINEQRTRSILLGFCRLKKKACFKELGRILFLELAKANADVADFLGYYKGGIKMVDGKRYKIASICDEDNMSITTVQLKIIASSYAGLEHSMQNLSLEIKQAQKQLQATNKEEANIAHEKIQSLQKELKALRTNFERQNFDHYINSISEAIQSSASEYN